MLADAAPDARALRALLRVHEHDRVPRKFFPLASRSGAARPLLHHADLHGPFDARAVLDRYARGSSEPAVEDDGLHDASDDDGHVPWLSIGPESVLRRAKRC